MKNLYSAFIKFQSEFKGLKPDSSNPFFKSSYISLDGILETIRPILSKNGLGVLQNAFSDNEGYMCVKTLLVHESGECLETEIMRMKPQKDDPQQRGSLVTYMKRYQLGALVGICESVDDDANKSTWGDSKPQEHIKGNSNKGKNPTDAQIKRLIAIASKKGYDIAAIKSMITKKYNKSDMKQLTIEEYEVIVKGFEGLEDKK